MTIFWIVLLVLWVVLGSLALWSRSVMRRVEQAVPADGDFAVVPGARLHYRELGPRDAPAIVLVHGILGSMRHFGFALAERLAHDHRVILIDRPGWGYSLILGKRPGIASQACMVAALLDKLGVEKPLLVGHSMGGALSLALALGHPGRVRGLALIAPFTQPVDEVPAPFRNLVVPAVLRPLIAWTVAVPVAVATVPKKVIGIFAPDPVPGDFGTRGGGLLSIRPPSFQMGSFEIGIAKQEMTAIAARYGELQLPVAILYGRGDTLLDPELHGRRTAEEIPGAELTLVEGGHMLPVTQPELVEGWLRGL